MHPAIPRIELMIAIISIPQAYNLLLKSQFKKRNSVIYASLTTTTRYLPGRIFGTKRLSIIMS